MSRALVEAIATRLETTGRTVYRHAVPDSPVERYLWVYGSERAESDNFASVDRMRDAVVWVKSVSRGERVQAAKEAMWGAEKAVLLLIGWRPAIGAMSFKSVHLDSQPATPDESLPDVTVMFTVDKFGYSYQP